MPAAAASESIVEAAKGVRVSESMVRVGPRVHMHPLKAAFRLICSGCIASVGGGSVIRIAITIAVVIGAVVIATVPGGVTIKSAVVIGNGPAGPVAIPRSPSPSAAPAASQSADSDARTKTEQRSRSNLSGRVAGRYIGRPARIA